MSKILFLAAMIAFVVRTDAYAASLMCAGYQPCNQCEASVYEKRFQTNCQTTQCKIDMDQWVQKARDGCWRQSRAAACDECKSNNPGNALMGCEVSRFTKDGRTSEEATKAAIQCKRDCTVCSLGFEN